MDADFIGLATELMAERARIGVIIKAIEEKVPVAVGVAELNIATEVDPGEADGLLTDLRKRLVVIDDQLTAGGVINLPHVIPDESIKDLVEQIQQMSDDQTEAA